MWTLVGLAIFQLLAFSIFTVNFLNIRPPNKSQNYHDKIDVKDRPRQALVDRMVFIVIDALRADFVYAKESPMSFVKSLLANGSAQGFVAKASAPTVTLPRLKALTAGTPPVFLDFLANLDERSAGDQPGKTNEDSWVKQLFLAGKRMVFLGDDTWLRLFPANYFIRTDPTTSFYVKDTVIVDRNVTRHLEDEFGKNMDDWDVMIMHYLGVDHIGHVEGAKGPLMGPKLKEMDGVIEQIYKQISQDQSKRTIMFILGDHGMTDSGNHGGSSPEEVNTAFVAIDSHFKYKYGASDDLQVIDQLDVAPTISSLFGVPLPRFGIGKIIRPLFEGRVNQSILHDILYENLVTLSKQDQWMPLKNYPKACSHDCSEPLDKVESMLNASRQRLSSQYGTYNVPVLLACLCVSLVMVVVLAKTQNPFDIAVSVIYCLSIMASSFIEEEHELWNHVIPLAILASKQSTVEKTIALLSARILRPWNSNGYEYRALPDMKMLLETNPVLKSACLLGALLLMIGRGRSLRSRVSMLIYSTIIFAFKSGLAKGPIVEKTILAAGVLLSSLDNYSPCLLLLMAISKVHNAMPLVLLTTISRGLQSNYRLILSIHHAYFAMGMSNLITSIDLSNAYMGLTEYNPAWVGFLTFIILFAGPIWCTITNIKMSNTRLDKIIFWRTITQFAVMLCCFIQRHHISVWTIFTPRLLFEVLWTAFYGFVVFPVSLMVANKQQSK